MTRIKERQLDWMRLDSVLKNVVPNISRPKKSRHFLMKLPDNFQIREHSRPCRFHIKNEKNNKKTPVLCIVFNGVIRKEQTLIWDRHSLFEGRSLIILRGRREKGMYFFFQVLFIFFLNYLTGVISLWHMAVPFILPMPLFRRESRRKSFLIRILFQVYFDFA
jgi:hypothetical protein